MLPVVVTPVTHGRKMEFSCPIIAVNLVTLQTFHTLPMNWTLIHEETRKDPTIKLLMHYICTGWPCECKRLPQELYPYWNFREDLSVKDGLVTKHSRLLIPSTLKW